LREDDYKEIFLESTSHPVAITPEAYEQIVVIAQANRLCAHCLKGYTQANLQVSENVCLACFQKRRAKDNQTQLTFAGTVPSEYAERYGYQVCKFLDQQGYVYLTTSHHRLNDTIERDIRATLVHYGFTVPQRYTLKGGKEVDLNTYSWRAIYGGFTTSPVVVATYHEYYGDHVDAAFLLYRDREPLEFSKTRNPVRLWYREAKAAIEATYTPHQGYIVGTGVEGEDRTAYHLYDHHLYPGIVARARSAYEQSLHR
jgi:hypothetical protein